MQTREVQDQLVTNMKRWQRVENQSAASTGEIIEKTDNPMVRLIMEIIQRDSQMHHRVQGFIADVTRGKAVSLTPDELGEVWDTLERHQQLEQQTIDFAQSALETLEGKGMTVQRHFLQYLLRDEQKHQHLLEAMTTIKQGMYPYA